MVRLCETNKFSGIYVKPVKHCLAFKSHLWQDLKEKIALHKMFSIKDFFSKCWIWLVCAVWFLRDLHNTFGGTAKEGKKIEPTFSKQVFLKIWEI